MLTCHNFYFFILLGPAANIRNVLVKEDLDPRWGDNLEGVI